MPKVHHHTLRNTRLHGAFGVYQIDGEGRLRHASTGEDPIDGECERFRQMSGFEVEGQATTPSPEAPKKRWPWSRDKREEEAKAAAEAKAREEARQAQARAVAEQAAARERAEREAAAAREEAQARRAAEAAQAKAQAEIPPDFALDVRIEHLGVPSSNVASMGYNPARRVLEVVFHSGDCYRYANVSPTEWGELEGAKSKGMALFTMRGRWPARQITPEEIKALNAAPMEPIDLPPSEEMAEEMAELVVPVEEQADEAAEVRAREVLVPFYPLHHTRKRAIALSLDPNYEVTFEGETITQKAVAAVHAAALVRPDETAAVIASHTI